MDYLTQLEQPQWLEKRKKILKNDKNRCNECINLSYQKKFNCGLVLSVKNEAESPAISSNIKITDRRNIWDLKSNFLAKENLSNLNLNTSENYIVFYELVNSYCRVTAVKTIQNSDVIINPSLYAIIKDKKPFFKGKFSELTFNKVYANIDKSDTWVVVKDLHIHHKYYQEGKMAWEYDDVALQTLCWECHLKLHQESVIPVLDDLGNYIGQLTNCKRCGGAGVFPEFNHIQNGICFRCNGKRFEEKILN